MSPSAEIRQIMSTEFLRLKGKNPSYSLRAFAKRIKLPVSAVSEIMRKNRSITPTMGERLLAELPIDPAHSTRLMSGLVAEKKAARVGATADSFSAIDMDQFHVISNWYSFAMLALFDTDTVQDDPQWIAERLGIRKSDAATMLTRLERLGLLSRDATGHLNATGKQFATSSDASNAALREFQSQHLDLAKRSLNEDPVHERDITGITMAIDPDLLPQAKLMIQQFRRTLCQFLESGAKSEVYRLNVQLIPLTRDS